MSSREADLIQAPLGKSSTYCSQYNPELLFPVPRAKHRAELAVPAMLPFVGMDSWNAYEVSWLDPKGKPQVALAQVSFAIDSANLIESKSFKLYLNSFNNTKFESFAQVEQTLLSDLSRVACGAVTVKLIAVEALVGEPLQKFAGQCLDELDVVCETYSVEPNFLSVGEGYVEEALYSNLLKSNCLVTGQPDWASICVEYKGAPIDKVGLLKYVVSFRNHNEFHEQCVERIFMDIKTRCNPHCLTVQARYTRRGGLEINPLRSTEKVKFTNFRMPRQ